MTTPAPAPAPCRYCGAPVVNSDGELQPDAAAIGAPCWNCFIQRPFGSGVCKACKAERPLVRRYLSGLFCDVHAPPRVAN